jgi:hypothetical protein
MTYTSGQSFRLLCDEYRVQKPVNSKSEYVPSSGGPIFTVFLLCDSAYLIALDVHCLQIRIRSSEVKGARK